MLVAWIRDRADHPAHFAIMHRHKRVTTLIEHDPLYAYLHLRFRRFIPELAHQLGKRRRIVHVGDANRKMEKSFVRQDGTRSEGGANQGVCNYVDIDSGAPPLIPTKPSRSKCKIIS